MTSKLFLIFPDNIVTFFFFAVSPEIFAHFQTAKQKSSSRFFKNKNMNTSRLAFCCSFRRDQRENKTKKNNGPDADECYGYRTRRLVLVPLTKRFCFVFFFAFEIKCFFFQATGHHKRHHRKQEEEDRRKIPTKNKKKKERKKEQKKQQKKNKTVLPFRIADLWPWTASDWRVARRSRRMRRCTWTSGKTR